MRYWNPGVSVYGLHELVGNALVMQGENENRRSQGGSMTGFDDKEDDVD